MEMNQEFYWINYQSFKRKLRKLVLTGAWKIEYQPYLTFNGIIKPTLFIQHQGRFFKKWVDESDIVELNVPIVSTNKCTSKFHKFGQTHELYHFREFKK